MKQWGNLVDFQKVSGCNIMSVKEYYQKGKIPETLCIVECGLHQRKYKINLPGLLQYMKNNRQTFRTLIKDKF